MRYNPDEDGRYPMDINEYNALLMMVGTVHTFASHKDELKDRLGLIPGGWRDMQLLAKVSSSLFEKILRTIPTKKLAVMHKELPHMVCETKLNPVAKSMHQDDVVIGFDALKRVVDRAIQMDCLFCEKSKCEGKKCQLYRDIDACFPFELSKPEEKLCPMAGRTEI